MNTIVKVDSNLTGKICVSDVNGVYGTFNDTVSQSCTSNLTSISSLAVNNRELLAKMDYSADLLAIDYAGTKMDSCVNTGITLDEQIKNVCLKLIGNTDDYKLKNDTEDVIIPPMKGFIEI